MEIPADTQPQIPAEQAQPQEHGRLRDFLLRRPVVAAVATLAMASALTGGIFARYRQSLEAAGSYELVVPQYPTFEAPAHSEQIVYWNIEGKTEEHRKDLLEIKKQHPKVNTFLFSEVTEELFHNISEDFPQWYGIFAIGTNNIEGKFGNAIFTKQEPTKPKGDSIEGAGLFDYVFGADVGLVQDATADFTNTVKGLINNQPTTLTKLNNNPLDSFDIDTSLNELHNFEAAMQENRVLIGANTSIVVGDRIVPLRLYTTHVSYLKSVHDRQYNEALRLVAEGKRPDQITVFCWEANQRQEILATDLSKIGYFAPAVSHDGGNKYSQVQGMSCSVNGTGLATLQALPTDRKTEHAPLLFILKEPSSKPLE